jgi:hypothetical protein
MDFERTVGIVGKILKIMRGWHYLGRNGSQRWKGIIFICLTVLLTHDPGQIMCLLCIHHQDLFGGNKRKHIIRSSRIRKRWHTFNLSDAVTV